MVTVLPAKESPGPPGSATVLAAPVERDGGPRTVGPFTVVLHIRLAELAPGALPVDADVRPHPHIGLTALSYVLDGAVTHRDSLGHHQELRAGDLGATVAGRGVVHSERFERNRLLGGAFEMFQLLLALPDADEDTDPSFFFRAKDAHATTADGGAHVRWLFPPPPAAPTGMPGATPILLADATLAADTRVGLPEAPERAVYVWQGEVEVQGARVRAGEVAVLAPGDAEVRAIAPARLLAFGGTTVGPRFLWWNYLHSSRARIEAAKAAWREARVTLPVGDTESFTPCPPDDGRPLSHLNGR